MRLEIAARVVNVRTDSEVVEAFLAHHKFALDKEMLLRRVVESRWAVDLAYDFAYEDPLHCWKILATLLTQTPPDDAMCEAAGVLTLLLREHPSSFDTIERDAAIDVRLAQLLSWVPDDEPLGPELWRRIEALTEATRSSD